MRKSLALLSFLLAWAFAQQVNLAKPEGPVVEAAVANINATLRIQGCARDQEGKVVCAVQIQSTARTNQQVAISHQGVRMISARGFSYPGYLSVDGGQLEATRSVFALPAGGRATGKLVFPNVPKEETFLSALYLSGVEFRGIPIGQAPAPQVQAPAAAPAAQTPTAEPWKRFVVGPFTFELVNGPYFRCCDYYAFEYQVTSSSDARLQIRFDSARTIVEGGIQGRSGYWEISGGRADFIAGIPLRVWVLLSTGANVRGKDILYTEFEVFDGKDWQKLVWRNIPTPKQ